MSDFKIIFPDAEVEVKAVLLNDKAPRTCEGFWKALAGLVETSGNHAMYTGREISVQLPGDVCKNGALHEVPKENLTCFPLPGDLLFTFMPKHAFGGLPFPIYDVGLFYGRDARTFFPMGWLPGNHFAMVSNENERLKLEKVGGIINEEGRQRVVFKRS